MSQPIQFIYTSVSQKEPLAGYTQLQSAAGEFCREQVSAIYLLMLEATPAPIINEAPASS